MATKLQELLEELKGLKRYTNAIDIKGYSHFIEQGNGKIIMKTDLEELIAKYTETTPTYKPGDKVRVTSKLSAIFNVEEIVTLSQFDEEYKSWLCVKDGNKEWLYQEEFEPIK